MQHLATNILGGGTPTLMFLVTPEPPTAEYTITGDSGTCKTQNQTCYLGDGKGLAAIAPKDPVCLGRSSVTWNNGGGAFVSGCLAYGSDGSTMYQDLAVIQAQTNDTFTVCLQ